jgi:hypothetical protein
MPGFLSDFSQGFSTAFGGDLPTKKGKTKDKDKTGVGAAPNAGDIAGADTGISAAPTPDPESGGQFARGGPVLPRSGVQGSKFFSKRR